MSWLATAAVKPLTHDPLGKPISAREKLVLFVLADYHNEERGFAWAGLKAIANAALTTRRHLITILGKLEGRGLLKVVRSDRETNHYYFPFLGWGSEATSLGSEISAGGVVKQLVHHPSEIASSPKPSVNLQKEERKECPSHPLFEIWQEEHGRLPQVRALAADRLSKCRARVKNASDAETFLADFREAVRKANQNAFLSGSNDRGWIASFDWFIANDSNYLKVLEGKYEFKGATNGRKFGDDLTRHNLEVLGFSAPAGEEVARGDSRDMR